MAQPIGLVIGPDQVTQVFKIAESPSLPVLDTYRNFLANPPIEGLLVLKAIRTFEFAA